MDYENLHKETLAALQQMVLEGKITEEIARRICADFVKKDEDEWIRKEIISFLKEGKPYYCPNSIRRQEWVSWLEKQGEQKLIDKVKSKFKVDDWITDGTSTFQIKSIDDGYYFANDGGCVCFSVVHQYYHPWTIQDAKDGDVLLSPSTPSGDKECPFIFKEIDENGIVRYHAALLQSKCFKIADGITNVMGYANAGYHTPTTKEQRDLLFQKMEEAGYEWDAEKKELKKIEQKPAWSEEDEKFFKTALWHISYSVSNGKRTDEHCDTTDWLKSVKERLKSMRPQSHKWYIKKGHWYMCIVDKPEYGWTKGKVYQSPEDNRIETDYKGDLTNWPDSEPWFRPATTNEIPNPQPHWKPSDLPHWKKSTLPNDNTTGFNSDYFCHKGYCINYKELFEKLPKDD